jgi:hypothetical protein
VAGEGRPVRLQIQGNVKDARLKAKQAAATNSGFVLLVQVLVLSVSSVFICGDFDFHEGQLR